MSPATLAIDLPSGVMYLGDSTTAADTALRALSCVADDVDLTPTIARMRRELLEVGDPERQHAIALAVQLLEHLASAPGLAA